MFKKTEVWVHLLGANTEKIFAENPWVKNIDECGYGQIENKRYFFRIYPYVQSYLYENFKVAHVSPKPSDTRLDLVICLNMNQEQIDALPRHHPNSLFVNFDQSGYDDVQACILDYPNYFNQQLVLDTKAKTPVLYAAMKNLNLPKEIISYIFQWYCCVDKISRPGTFLFFGQKVPPRPNIEIATHFMLDCVEAAQDMVTNLFDNAEKSLSSFIQRPN